MPGSDRRGENPLFTRLLAPVTTILQQGLGVSRRFTGGFRRFLLASRYWAYL